MDIQTLDAQLNFDLGQAINVVEKTLRYPRVSKELIESKISSTSYFITEGMLTICVIQMRNGFEVTGQAAAADPRNYNREVGKRFAYEDAFKKIWPLEGYLLKETIFKANQMLEGTGLGFDASDGDPA